MYFAGNFNIDKWDLDAEYAVFDDITWTYLPAKKQLLGCQWEFELTDKYRRKRSVTYGLPAIVLCNRDGWLDIANDPMFDWIKDNMIVVEIKDALFYFVPGVGLALDQNPATSLIYK